MCANVFGMSDKKSYKLRDLAGILHGHPFRTAIREVVDGNLLVVQARDVRENFYIDTTRLRRIALEDKNNFLLQKEDIIFSIRAFLRASVIDVDQKIIASASVCIIRPKTSLIIPEYLALYMNSRRGQANIRRYSIGSAIKTILMRDLREIEILVPPMSEQKLIVDLYRNITKQEQLMEKRKKINKQIFESIL
jgi:type I restriction enzyme S subunit